HLVPERLAVDELRRTLAEEAVEGLVLVDVADDRHVAGLEHVPGALEQPELAELPGPLLLLALGVDLDEGAVLARVPVLVLDGGHRRGGDAEVVRVLLLVVEEAQTV